MAAGLIGAGYADFPLSAFHFGKAAIVSPNWIPLFYAVAMGVDAVAALILGRLFDRLGMPVIIGISCLSALFALLVFWGGLQLALVGTILWGIGTAPRNLLLKPP